MPAQLLLQAFQGFIKNQLLRLTYNFLGTYRFLI